MADDFDWKAEVAQDIDDPSNIVATGLDRFWSRAYAFGANDGAIQQYLQARIYAIKALIGSIWNEPEFTVDHQGTYKLHQRVDDLMVMLSLTQTDLNDYVDAVSRSTNSGAVTGDLTNTSWLWRNRHNAARFCSYQLPTLP